MGVATGIAIAGAATSAYSAYDASQKKKSAQKALNNLQTPELVNSFKDQQVSTLGSDLRKQEASRTTASSIDALRGAGARGIIGGIGAVQDNNNKMNAEIGANLDEQQKNINNNIAQDNLNIRGINEGRFQDKVTGLSSQINSAENAKQQGIGNTINGLTTAGSEYNAYKDKKGMTPEQIANYNSGKKGGK
jgi:hypothetical protein